MQPRVIDAVWTAVRALLPRPVVDHPLGCHRPRIHDRVCFEGILYRLVLGCSWVTAGRLVGVGATTLRRRRDEWIAAGVFDALCAEALAGYDRVRGLDLSEVAVDGSLHKAPCGGQGTGANPTDRGKLGWKWSLATDRNGIPVGWAIDGANRHDVPLLAPTLDDIEARAGLLAEIQTLHLDRGYDANTVRDLCADRDLHDHVIATKRKPGQAKRDRKRQRKRDRKRDERSQPDGQRDGQPDNGEPDERDEPDGDKRDNEHGGDRAGPHLATKIIPPGKGNGNGEDNSNTKGKGKGKGDKSLGLGLRWPVERSNSWLSNYGQLRRNTDRFTIHRLAQIALAVALILTVKLIKWADRWSPRPPS